MKKLSSLLAAGLLALATTSVLHAQAVFLTGTGEPWGTTSLADSMNRAFGSDNWTRTDWASIDLGSVLSSSSFLYVDGGADQDVSMQAFLTENLASLDSWVSGGGHLFLNSAGWATGIVTGLGDSQLALDYSSVGTAAAGSPVWVGPNAVGTSYTGSAFAHDIVLGSGLTTLTVGNAGVTLAYRNWGLGRLVLGGETSPYYWTGNDPIGLKANELVFASEGSVLPTAVPESSTYGLFGALALAVLGLVRRLPRQRAA